MPITYVGAGADSSAGANTNINLTVPAGVVEGDLLMVAIQGASVNDTISGWSQIAYSGADATRMQVIYKYAGSSESTLDYPGNFNHVYGRMFAWRGVDSTVAPVVDFLAASGTANASTSISWGAVTTTVANSLVVVVAGWDLDNAGPLLSSVSNGNLTGLAELSDGGTTQGHGGGIALAAGIKSTTGSTGTTSGTWSSSTSHGKVTVAFAPSLAAPYNSTQMFGMF